jgi:putative acetyltransferase
VARDARRQGLGALLSGLLEDEALSLWKSFVDLWSDTRFQDVHRLYEHLGYVRGAQTRELHDVTNTIEFYYRKTGTS